MRSHLIGRESVLNLCFFEGAACVFLCVVCVTDVARSFGVLGTLVGSVAVWAVRMAVRDFVLVGISDAHDLYMKV